MPEPVPQPEPTSPAGPNPEHGQRGYRVRLEWGLAGVELLAADCAVVIVVDVLSFCTSVDIAVGPGAEVVPQRWADPQAARPDAVRLGATPAGPRSGGGPSLRPSSLLGLPAGTRLALPSPNGATLCAAAANGNAAVFAGCLPNAAGGHLGAKTAIKIRGTRPSSGRRALAGRHTAGGRAGRHRRWRDRCRTAGGGPVARGGAGWSPSSPRRVIGGWARCSPR